MPDKKKIRVIYFFMENQYIECLRNDMHKMRDELTDEKRQSNMPPPTSSKLGA